MHLNSFTALSDEHPSNIDSKSDIDSVKNSFIEIVVLVLFGSK